MTTTFARLLLILALGPGFLPTEGFAQFKSSSPFGQDSEPRYKVNSTANKTFDLSKIGLIGREETMPLFEKIWNEYRSKHQLDSDGTFIEAETGSTPNTVEAKAFFYVLVKSSPQEIKVIEKQDCPQCDGKGRKKDPVSMQYVDCGRCDATGKLANIFIYTVTHSGELPAGIAKFLPKKAPEPKTTAGQPTMEGLTKPADGSLEAQTREAAQKQLADLLSSKLSGLRPEGFGVSNAAFSAPNGIHWQLDLEFQNKELIKVTSANVRISFFEKGYGSKPTIVATTEVRLPLGSSDKAAVSFSEFTYPALKSLANSKSKSDAFADYASVLKQLKRANDILITIKSVSPINAQKAIDIEAGAVWEIKRNVDSAGSSTQKTPTTPQGGPKSTSFGSGMVFTKDGHIFTNYHVIGKANTISIVTYENGQLTSKLPATVISKDQRTDLAILQCKGWKPAEGAPATPPPIVSSSNCKLGDQVFVLGYPLPGTVSSNVKYTKGDVSDMAGLDDDSSKIQHTAQIQPGNSGGPMALMDGRIIGIIVSSLSEMYAMKTSGALPQGVNFSIKSDYVLTQASIAGIEVPKGQASSEPVAHVKAYTVQIMCEK